MPNNTSIFKFKKLFKFLQIKTKKYKCLFIFSRFSKIEMTEKIHTALILVDTTPTTNSNKKSLVLFLQAMAGNGTPEKFLEVTQWRHH